MNRILTPKETVNWPLSSSRIIPDDPENSELSVNTGVYVAWNLFRNNECLRDQRRKCPFALVNTREVLASGFFETTSIVDFNYAMGISIQEILKMLDEDPELGDICTQCRFLAREAMAVQVEVAEM